MRYDDEMRGWLVALPVMVTACATLSGLDELDVCDGSACVDAVGSDANVTPDTSITNDASTDVAQDVAKDGGGGDGTTDSSTDSSMPLTVPCGNSPCVLDGGTACCAVEAGAPFCWDPPDCVGFTLVCTGKAQCSGEVCCASNVDLTQGMSGCAASCGAGHPVQLCNLNDPPPVCAGNKSCTKLTNGPLANLFYACL